MGTFLSNGERGGDLYRCDARACSGLTFRRSADLKRHHRSLHGVGRVWCPVDGCKKGLRHVLRYTSPLPTPTRFDCKVSGANANANLGDRSMQGVGNPFPRNDKMLDHLRRKHADRTRS